MTPSVCVIQFPGVNCEYETARALEKVGLRATIVRWNAPRGPLADYQGFVLPGGFSYQDRVRAGAIAASEDIMEVLIEQAALGKPILGICNGAQVLVESGLVPGRGRQGIDLALAPNKGMGRDGYYANWVYVSVETGPRGCAITRGLEPGEVIPIPVAHGEGRFTSSEAGLFESLEEAGQVVLKYCRSDGTAALGFPEDPNGSELAAAAISNVKGNVVAMMPHPERGTWLRQVPGGLDNEWSRKRLEARGSWESLEGEGPGACILRSIKTYIEELV
jgi:phosphoribosylformylglycinamidine synthase I